MRPLSELAEHVEYFGSSEPHLIDNLQVRLEVAALSRLRPNWAEYERVRDFHKFYYFLEGAGWIRIGGVDYEPQPGQLFLLPAGVEHSFSTDANRPFMKYWCHFFADVGNVPLFDLLRPSAFVEVSNREELERLFRQLINNANRRDTTGSLLVKSSLMEIIAYFLERTGQTAASNTSVLQRSAGKLKSVLRYMEQHLSRSVTVEELARIAHLSPNYFNRYFHEVLGVPPIQYMNRLRIEKAKQLLLTTNATIGEAASSLGWELYYFSRVFKKVTGYAPQEYRKLFRSIGLTNRRGSSIVHDDHHPQVPAENPNSSKF